MGELSRGPDAVGFQANHLHLLFDEVNGAVTEHIDLIAERIVQLGGVAEGTARVVAGRSTLLDYHERRYVARPHDPKGWRERSADFCRQTKQMINDWTTPDA